ncbi:hypothetical protein TNCV_103811 [Trichonephila clavipes]|nr:hypothetical protein TNCV_103811 [Trichonephila clavipes]
MCFHSINGKNHLAEGTVSPESLIITPVFEDKINVSLQFLQVRIGLPKNSIIRKCADHTFPLDITHNA